MLTRVRTHNDMIAWIKFFLEAVIETSKDCSRMPRNLVIFDKKIYRSKKKKNLTYKLF